MVHIIPSLALLLGGDNLIFISVFGNSASGGEGGVSFATPVIIPQLPHLTSKSNNEAVVVLADFEYKELY